MLGLGCTVCPSAGSIVHYSVLAFRNKSNCDCVTTVIVKNVKTQWIQEKFKRIRMTYFDKNRIAFEFKRINVRNRCIESDPCNKRALPNRPGAGTD